jgi:hypothetical protein
MDLFDLIADLPSISEQKEIDKLLAKNPDLIYDDVPLPDDKKVDIFNLLQNVDYRNLSFYNRLTENEQKTFPLYVAMRWLSGVSDSSVHRDNTLFYVNNVLNVDFDVLSKHPEFMWKLMAAGGCGTKLRYNWIPSAKKSKTSNKVDEFMLRWYPSANDLELKILTGKMTRDEFEQFAKSAESDDRKIKELLEDFDIQRGVKPKKATKKRKD